MRLVPEPAGSSEPQQGDRRPNLRDVAQRAGVAVSSASRVISGHPDVSPSMRRRVEAAITDLDYEPNFLAQSMRRGATLTVGFVVRDIASPLLAGIAAGAEVALRAGDHQMLVLNSGADPLVEVEHLRLLDRRRVAGVLLSMADESNTDSLAALHALSVPVVLIDRQVPDAPDASAVLVDHGAGMRQALEHLAALGHRSIGLAAGPLHVRPGREAVRTFTATCAELGIAPALEAGPFSAGHGYAAALALLEKAPAPTALISGSNQIFPGVLTALRERGLRVPDDISLVTFDDLPLLELLEPPIDVVRRDVPAFGATAAELLLRRMRDEPAETVVVTTAFVPRGSSASPRAR
jgi:LacI family transcriptional regulator